MSRHVESNQAFFMFAIKLTLDNFKSTRQRHDRTKEVVSYIVTHGKKIVGRRARRNGKGKGTEMKSAKNKKI